MVDTRANKYDETPASTEARHAGTGRVPSPPSEPVAERPSPMKLSYWVDPKEEKAYAALCAQLAFKPERGEPALAFKMRATDKLQHIPKELQLSVLLRAVSETDAGTKWLHGLHTQLAFPTTLEAFWEAFTQEYLPIDPVSSAYMRLFSVRQGTYMSASSYVDAFRDAVSNLYALDAPYISEEALSHFFLYRASAELRHAVRLQMLGRKYTLSAVMATAVQVGAESRRPPAARVHVVSTTNKGCTVCGKKGHHASECWHKKHQKPQDKPQPQEGNKKAAPEPEKEKGTPK